jgi:hypothetical protein
MGNARRRFSDSLSIPETHGKAVGTGHSSAAVSHHKPRPPVITGGEVNRGEGLGEGEGRGGRDRAGFRPVSRMAGNAESEYLPLGCSPAPARMRAPAKNLHRINEG